MSILYKSSRIGKNGKRFLMLKFKTLKDGSDGSMFADGNTYTKYGRFLRKYKIDELPQLWNVIKGDLAIVGPRAEETRTSGIIPEKARNVILKVKPGLTSPASIHFIDEEKIMQEAKEPGLLYWTTVKPMKILLDIWYVEHKSFLLDIAIIWGTIKSIIKR